MRLRDAQETIWTPDGDGCYSALDGTYAGWTREEVNGTFGPVTEIDPFRHGNRNPRNIYFGAEEHLAVVVGTDETNRSQYLVDALNAYWAAGHRPGEDT